MKKAAIYIVIGALALSAAVYNSAQASEVSGTVDTSGNSSTDTSHSSEVEGSLNTGNVNGGSSSEIGGTVEGGSNPNGGTNTNTGPVVFGFVDNGNIYHGNATIGGEVVGGTQPGISDEEAAHLAMLAFGPRYGVTSGGSSEVTPGPPDAGSGADLSVGTTRSAAEAALRTIGNNDDELYNFPKTAVFVPRSGQGPVSAEDQLAVSSIRTATGLSMTQLALIAIIGLILLASMGYAISRGGSTGGGATPA